VLLHERRDVGDAAVDVAQVRVAVPPQRSETEIVLRSRRQRAAFFDRGDKASTQDNLDQGGLVARIQPGGWIGFDRIRLQEFGRLKLSAWPQGTVPLTVSILAGEKELDRQKLSPGPAISKPQEFIFPMPPANAEVAPQQVRVRFDGPEGSVLDVMWVEFLPR